MTRFTGWTVLGILAAATCGFVHAFSLWGKDITRRAFDMDCGPVAARFHEDEYADGFGPSGY